MLYAAFFYSIGERNCFSWLDGIRGVWGEPLDEAGWPVALSFRLEGLDASTA